MSGNEKNTVGLIAIIAVVSIAIFAGCVEEEHVEAQVSHSKIKTSSVGQHASKISAISWSYSSSLNSY